MKSAFAMVGALAAAFVASLCCIGPLLFVGLGIGGAGLASTFEPIRPWLLGGTAVFLGLGFYSAYAPGPRCAGEEQGERRRSRHKVLLWIGTILVLLFATFPTWGTWIL